jgi:hypothetical protein
LRAGIARGRLCTSALVVTRRKPSLFEPFMEGTAMAGVEALWPTMGSSPEKKGGGRGEGGGGARLLGCRGWGAPWEPAATGATLLVRGCCS